MIMRVGPVAAVLRVTVIINDAAVGIVEIVVGRLAVLLGDGSRAAQPVVVEEGAIWLSMCYSSGNYNYSPRLNTSTISPLLSLT